MKVRVDHFVTREQAEAYPPDDVREDQRVCGPHAQPWEREHNREMKDVEESLLAKGLDLLGSMFPDQRTAEDAETVLDHLDFPEQP